MNNDLIRRSDLLENYGLKNAVKYGNKTEEQQHNSYSTLMLYEVADMILDAPAVDAVEVVRCNDCEHYNGHRWCLYIGDAVQDYDFCSYGRKMDAEVEG